MQVYVPMTQAGLDDTFLLVRPATGDGGGARAGGARGHRPHRHGAARERRRGVRRSTTSPGRRPRRIASARCWSAAFAGLALVLAMVGVFGILAYSVQQRVRDFAVRRAMGATTGDVLRLVAGQRRAASSPPARRSGWCSSPSRDVCSTTVLFGVGRWISSRSRSSRSCSASPPRLRSPARPGERPGSIRRSRCGTRRLPGILVPVQTTPRRSWTNHVDDQTPTTVSSSAPARPSPRRTPMRSDRPGDCSGCR